MTGNAIGASKVALAKRFVVLIAKVTALLVVIISVILFSCSEQIVSLFTNDLVVEEKANTVLKLMSAVYIFDSAQNYLCGPIRALNPPAKALNWAMLLLLILGLPLACLLCFYSDMGLFGLQLGIGIAVFLQTIIYAYCVYSCDWDLISEKAVKRIAKEKQQLKELKRKIKIRKEMSRSLLRMSRE